MKRNARVKFIKILEKYNQTFPDRINQESVSDLKKMASLGDRKEIDAIVRLISKKEEPDEREEKEYAPLDDEDLKELILYNLNNANFWNLLREFRRDAGSNKSLVDFEKWMIKVGIREGYEEAWHDRKAIYLVKETTFDEIERFSSLAQACDKLGLNEYRASYVGADKGISIDNNLMLITRYGLKLLRGYKY